MTTKHPGYKLSADTLTSLVGQPPPSPSNRHKIGATLRPAIIEGSLQPGDRLNQQAVADFFGLSRMPVREALRSLEVQGYITADRYKAYIVADSEAGWTGDLLGLLRAVREHHSRLVSTEAQRDFGSQVMQLLKSLDTKLETAAH